MGAGVLAVVLCYFLKLEENEIHTNHTWSAKLIKTQRKANTRTQPNIERLHDSSVDARGWEVRVRVVRLPQRLIRPVHLCVGEATDVVSSVYIPERLLHTFRCWGEGFIRLDTEYPAHYQKIYGDDT